MKKIIIIGTGGHSKVIINILEKTNKKIYGLLDDDVTKIGKNIYNYPILGTTQDIKKYCDNYNFIIAIGNNYIRKKIAENNKNLNFISAIDPSAIIAKNIAINEGTVIMPKAIINQDSIIGKHCIINSGSIIEHDNIINDYVHLSPGTNLGGTVEIGELSHIGIGATIINNITIAPEVIIGAGAVVIRNILSKQTVVGIPATPIVRKEKI